MTSSKGNGMKEFKMHSFSKLRKVTIEKAELSITFPEHKHIFSLIDLSTISGKILYIMHLGQ